jgi:hypothetical protein
MSRPSFAIFVQQYLAALLNEFGTVYLNEPMPRDPKMRVYKYPSRSNPATSILQAITANNPRVMVNPEIIAEAQLVDVLFEPNPELSRESLGLVGEFLFVPSIIQSLRWSPNARTMRKCLQQWLIWDSADHGGIIPVDEEPVYEEEDDDDYDADEDGDDNYEPEEVTKILLTIVPSIDHQLIQGFGLNSSARNILGVYEFPPLCHATVIATNELPKTPSTLFLRILGRGPTQRGAIEELIALESSHPQRLVALQSLQDWYHLLLDGRMGRESAALMQSLSLLLDRNAQ